MFGDTDAGRSCVDPVWLLGAFLLASYSTHRLDAISASEASPFRGLPRSTVRVRNLIRSTDLVLLVSHLTHVQPSRHEPKKTHQRLPIPNRLSSLANRVLGPLKALPDIVQIFERRRVLVELGGNEQSAKNEDMLPAHPVRELAHTPVCERAFRELVGDSEGARVRRYPLPQAVLEGVAGEVEFKGDLREEGLVVNRWVVGGAVDGERL